MHKITAKKTKTLLPFPNFDKNKGPILFTTKSAINPSLFVQHLTSAVSIAILMTPARSIYVLKGSSCFPNKYDMPTAELLIAVYLCSVTAALSGKMAVA